MSKAHQHHYCLNDFILLCEGEQHLYLPAPEVDRVAYSKKGIRVRVQLLQHILTQKQKVVIQEITRVRVNRYFIKNLGKY